MSKSSAGPWGDGAVREVRGRSDAFFSSVLGFAPLRRGTGTATAGRRSERSALTPKAKRRRSQWIKWSSDVLATFDQLVQPPGELDAASNEEPLADEVEAHAVGDDLEPVRIADTR